MQNINRRVFASSAIWKMLESLSTKGISTVISIILARLLAPEYYGIVAFTSVFIFFSTIFVQSGLHTTLIRSEDTDDLDYSNAFFFSMGIATLCYIVFFLVAPYIGNYYKEPIITPVLRVQMLSLFLCALVTVPNAIIVRQFRFRELYVTNLIANAIGGVVGIWLAYCGFGVWALVIYTLIRDAFSAFLLFFFVRWRLVFSISIERLKKLVSFSSWVLLATILDFCGNNIFNTVFGKMYSMEALGYYSRGLQLPELISLHTFGAITSVLLPTMAGSQKDLNRLKIITRKITIFSSYIILPMMGGLAVVGRLTIPLLFTDKWLTSVPILWAACIYYGLNIFRCINMQLIYAIGNSKTGMKIELIRFLMLLISVTFGILELGFDIYSLAFLSAIINICVVLITQYHVNKLIDYSFFEWLKDILPSLLLTMGMSLFVYCVGLIKIPSVMLLILQIVVGALFYCVFSKIFKLRSFIDILDIIKKLSRRSNRFND